MTIALIIDFYECLKHLDEEMEAIFDCQAALLELAKNKSPDNSMPKYTLGGGIIIRQFSGNGAEALDVVKQFFNSATHHIEAEAMPQQVIPPMFNEGRKIKSLGVIEGKERKTLVPNTEDAAEHAIQTEGFKISISPLPQ
jgi:hypothetical protein